MEVLYTILISCLLLLCIGKYPFFQLKGIPKHYLQVTFVFKIGCSFLLYFLYTNVYDKSSADIFKYFGDGKIMNEAFWFNPIYYFQMLFGFDENEILREYYVSMSHWYRKYDSLVYNDNRTIIRINSIVHFLSFGYYHAHTILLIFLAFIGQIALLKFLQEKTRIQPKILLLLVFFIPSIALWTSGNLKETVLFFAFGLFTYCTNKLGYEIRNVKYFLISFLCLMLCLFIKPYVIIIFIPGLIGYFVYQKWRKYSPFIVHSSIWIFFIGTSLSLGLFFKWDTLYILSRKQNDFIRLAEQTNSGSYIKTDFLEPKISDVILHSPQAIYRAFFRPFFFESKSPLIIFSGLENLCFFLLFISTFLFRNKLDYNGLNLVFFFGAFTFFNLLLIGLTTPVMGAIVRYKIPILPFMLTVFLTLIDIEKLQKSFKSITPK